MSSLALAFAQRVPPSVRFKRQENGVCEKPPAKLLVCVPKSAANQKNPKGLK
jgi:hypothetical protein